MTDDGKVYLCKADELEDGDIRGFDIAGTPVALYCDKGEFFATHDICTHEYALLSDGFLEDGIVECPLHAGTFDIRTGEAKAAPCVNAVRTYTVSVVDGDVFLVLPK